MNRPLRWLPATAGRVFGGVTARARGKKGVQRGQVVVCESENCGRIENRINERPGGSRTNR
jgi:hypothetical protein